MRDEFRSFKVNRSAVKDMDMVRNVMETALDNLEKIINKQGREMSIVKTKMEEAGFFAIKAIASNPVNWIDEDKDRG
jgi:hypothetical protein